MNKDLIETPRFNFFIGDEVFLKGKIVGFDVDENKCVENVVRLGYGETLNVPNNDIYITDDIVDKSKIKVTIPQSVADWIRKCKMFKHFAVSLSFALQPIVWEENNLSDKCIDWLMDANNQELFARAWLNGYEVEKEKRYLVTLKNRQPLVKSQSGSTLYFSQDITARNYKGTQKELEEAKFGWVFDCEGIDIEEVE